MTRLTDEEVEAQFEEKFGKWPGKQTEKENLQKVICKINTPQHKKGEVVDRFDLEIDRLEYPDVYMPTDMLSLRFRGSKSMFALSQLIWETNKEKES